MKKMLRMALMSLGMFMVVTTVAHAQGRGGRGMNPVVVLKDSLHVSDAVAAKADSIWKAWTTEQQGLMEAARGGDADARAKMTEGRTKAMDAIKALLTDDQKTQFDKMMPQRGGRRGGGL